MQTGILCDPATQLIGRRHSQNLGRVQTPSRYSPPSSPPPASPARSECICELQPPASTALSALLFCRVCLQWIRCLYLMDNAPSRHVVPEPGPRPLSAAAPVRSGRLTYLVILRIYLAANAEWASRMFSSRSCPAVSTLPITQHFT